jgi:hypothetical protein
MFSMNNPWMMRRPPQFYGPNQQAAWGQQNVQPNGQQPMFPQQQPPRPAPANNGDGTNQLYLLLKMGFLVYILSQGASTTRTLLLSVVALVAFLYAKFVIMPSNCYCRYQTGRLQIFSFGPAQGPAQPRNQVNPNINNNPQPQQPQPQQPNNVDNIAPQDNRQAQGQQPPATGGIVGAVMPFFYSLLPSWNPGVQPNLVPAAPNPGMDN